MLLDVMVLSDYWDFKSLHEAVQLKIIELRVINPLRLAHSECSWQTLLVLWNSNPLFLVKTQAANAQATMVIEACVKYEQKNRHLLQSFTDVEVGES